VLQEWSTEYFQFILDHPDINWDWYAISRNPNLNWDVVQNNPNKPWNYSNLSCNTMDVARNNYIRKKFQEWFKKSELKSELMAKSLF
jgi:hypothetical protein